VKIHLSFLELPHADGRTEDMTTLTGSVLQISVANARVSINISPRTGLLQNSLTKKDEGESRDFFLSCGSISASVTRHTSECDVLLHALFGRRCICRLDRTLRTLFRRRYVASG
jgi:hypothetical protein